MCFQNKNHAYSIGGAAAYPFSIEVFINDGEQVMTATILTDTDAQGISFNADGQVSMDITKYSLFAGE